MSPDLVPSVTLDRAAALLATLLFAGCATSQKKLDETSADEHLRKAAAELADAKHEKKLYDPNVRSLHPNLDRAPASAELPDENYNPTQPHLDKAKIDLAHAREHEAEAAKLKAFEAVECQSVSAELRASCPMLGPIARVVDIAKGVRLEYAEGADIQTIVGLMRCHLAYARARGYGVASGCPLYMRGVDIELAHDGRSVNLTASDGAGADELRRRSREMVPGGGK